MRKLLVGHQGRGAGTSEEGAQSSQHTALGLMHLHKLFAELSHPAHPLTQQEQEQRLYNMLPLFCKVRAPMHSSKGPVFLLLASSAIVVEIGCRGIRVAPWCGRSWHHSPGAGRLVGTFLPRGKVSPCLRPWRHYLPCSFGVHALLFTGCFRYLKGP